MKALIVFGSDSDSKIFNEIAQNLKEAGMEYDLHVCSAHRTPDILEDLLKKNYDVVIAGAGLAAHLPGVVASKTITPTIGVPVNNNFEGMDSLLSIVQMPPGIPVIGVGVDNAKQAAQIATWSAKELKSVNIVGKADNKTMDKLIGALKDLEVEYTESDELKEGVVNIDFVPIGMNIKETNEAVINIPIAQEVRVEDTKKLMQSMKAGAWVGVNRGENAALAAAQIIGKKDEMKKYREKQREKVIEADRRIQNDK